MTARAQERSRAARGRDPHDVARPTTPLAPAQRSTLAPTLRFTLAPTQRFTLAPTLRFTLALIVLCALTLTACGGGSPAPRPSKTAPPVLPAPKADWKDCPLTGQPTRECATLKVPIDAAKPGSGTLDLAVSRLPATDRKRRVGVLVMDPGGPGLPGRYTTANLLPPQLRALFDVVGFDRRGSGLSTPVNCGETGGPVQRIAETAPADLAAGLSAADRTAITGSVTAYLTKCRAKYGELTAHLGTKDVVSDLESIRLAVGEDKLSLLLLSYGTLLGQEYQREHPDRVRAVVLDGAVDPGAAGARFVLGSSMSLQEADGTAGESAADQRAFRLRAMTAGFRSWCSASGPAECAIAPEPEQTLSAVAARTPELLRAANATMVVPADWPGFSRAVATARAAKAGDPAAYTALKAYADKGFPKDVTAALKHGPASLAFTLGNHCADFTWAKDTTGVLKDITATAKELGKLDAAPANAASYVACATWPRAATALGPITAKDAPHALIVNAEKDPRTPLPQAESVADRLPAALLRTGGGVHGVTMRGSDCVNRVLLKTLVDGVRPGDGRCPGV